jgi:pimeloyl-ACP methyl ester carboxylesterase
MTSAAIDATGLSYREQGAGTPVVLIHGTAASTWGDLPDRLAGYRVVAYDRRGFGASGGEPGISLSDHATDAAELLTALDAAPAIVVGWSIGGVIALELTAARPELVSGLVIVEAPLHAKRHPRPRMVAAIVAAQLLGRAGRPQPGARRFLDWACRNVAAGRGLDCVPEGARAAMLDNGAAIVAELGGGTGEHLGAAALAAIEAPIVWLVGGDSDPAFGAAARRAAAALPSAEFRTVPGSAHAMQFDRPDAIVDAIRRTDELAAS